MRVPENITGCTSIVDGARPSEERGPHDAEPGFPGRTRQSPDLSGTETSGVDDNRVDPPSSEPGKGRRAEGCIAGHTPKLGEKCTLSRVGGGGVRGNHCGEGCDQQQL